MAATVRHAALALLEYGSVAAGIAAVDRMVKAAPIALLRAGTVHPGRFLALVGGSVASTEVAHGVGRGTETAVVDEVFLGDIHPALHDATLGGRQPLVGDALAVLETATSPTLLRAVDAAVKGVPLVVGEVRLADDLGGRAVALLAGDLTAAETAIEIALARTGGALAAAELLPRLDDDVRRLLDAGTRFAAGEPLTPAGAEFPEEVACSWDG